MKPPSDDDIDQLLDMLRARAVAKRARRTAELARLEAQLALPAVQPDQRNTRVES